MARIVLEGDSPNIIDAPDDPKLAEAFEQYLSDAKVAGMASAANDIVVVDLHQAVAVEIGQLPEANQTLHVDFLFEGKSAVETFHFLLADFDGPDAPHRPDERFRDFLNDKNQDHVFVYKRGNYRVVIDLRRPVYVRARK